MSIKKGTTTLTGNPINPCWGNLEGNIQDQVDLNNILTGLAPKDSAELTGRPTAPTPTAGLNNNQLATTAFVQNAISSSGGGLPSQAGNSGKFLTTNGTTASWANVDALPSQSGQAGKVLTTNGSVASWTEYSSAPDVDGDTIHLNGSDELESIGVIEKNSGNVKYDWIGTYAQWTAGRANHTIDDNWICYITDDYTSSTVTHNIGDIFYSLRTDTMFNGAVVCDGTQYDIADYSEGTQSLKSLLDDGKLPYISITDFDAAVTANGSCRCFGYDGSTATVFKVPKLNDVFIEAGIAANNSEFIEAGLPNIISNLTKTTGLGTIIPTSISNVSATGAFKVSGDITNSKIDYSQNSGIGITTLEFDASNSNSIYGNSNTVQPNSVKYRAYIQLANGTTESALQTVSSVVNDVETLKDEIKETLQYKNITNCITEIPQDIKLELNNGTLTLKAGSKVFIPNGFESDGVTRHFDEYIIPSDISQSTPQIVREKSFVNLNYNKTALIVWLQKDVYTGDTTPTIPNNNAIWYDTANNIIKYTGDGGSTWISDASLPFCLASSTATEWTSLDQVFNGIGYIGSCVFVLPGVKGLIPNGRNADGTLKNIILNVPSVFVNSYDTIVDSTRQIVIKNTTFSAPDLTTFKYDEINNINLYNGNYSPNVKAGEFELVDGKITNLNIKTTFRALDWNDKSSFSGWGMPSSKYVDLTLGASGTQYTAPANGWFQFAGSTTAGGNNAKFINTKNGMNSSFTGIGQSGYGFARIIPVLKGDTVTFSHAGVSGTMRFIYAEGEL